MADKKKVLPRLIALALIVGALVLAYEAAVRPWAMRQKYAVKYADTILKSAETHGVDPYLVVSMVYCESSFQTDAQSNVGARGLMQVMPDTGVWLAKKLDINNYEEKMLFDPETNVSMGCWYLRFLLDRYKWDYTCAVAAYHCGQGTLDKWLADPAISSDGKTLTAIPQNETSKYTTRVLNAYEIYRELYPNGLPAE